MENAGFLEILHEEVQDRAIPFPLQLVNSTRVFGNLLSVSKQAVSEHLKRFGKNAGGADVQKIETVAEVDQCADYGGFPDFAASFLLLRPLHRPFWSMLPKVDPFTEPVVIVFAGGNVFSGEDGLIRHRSIAAVVAEDKALIS